MKYLLFFIYREGQKTTKVIYNSNFVFKFEMLGKSEFRIYRRFHVQQGGKKNKKKFLSLGGFVSRLYKKNCWKRTKS